MKIHEFTGRKTELTTLHAMVLLLKKSKKLVSAQRLSRACEIPREEPRLVCPRAKKRLDGICSALLFNFLMARSQHAP